MSLRHPVIVTRAIAAITTSDGCCCCGCMLIQALLQFVTTMAYFCKVLLRTLILQGTLPEKDMTMYRAGEVDVVAVAVRSYRHDYRA